MVGQFSVRLKAEKLEILKARKNMKISPHSISLLLKKSRSLPFIPKSTSLSLLKKVRSKQRTFLMDGNSQFSPYMGFLVWNERKIMIKAIYPDMLKKPLWRNLLFSMKNLKDLTVQFSSSSAYFSFKHFKLERLSISIPPSFVMRNTKWFVSLTLVKKLHLSLNLTYNEEFTLSNEKLQDAFGNFWKKIFANKRLQDFEFNFTDVYERAERGFPALNAFLDSLNASQVTSFCLRIDVDESNNSLMALDKLEQIVEKTQLFSLQHYTREDTRPPRKYAREIFLYGGERALLIVKTVTTMCKMPYLEHLILGNISRESENLIEFTKLFENFANKKLSSFELNFRGTMDLKTENFVFNNLLALIETLGSLRNLAIGLHTTHEIQDETFLWNLLPSGLNTLRISITTAKDNIDLSLLFNKLSQMANMEDLFLEINSKTVLDKQKVLNGLPPNLKNLKN